MIRALLAAALTVGAASAACAQQIGVGLSITELALRTPPLTTTPATFIPALQFNDARNSQYIPLL